MTPRAGATANARAARARKRSADGQAVGARLEHAGQRDVGALREAPAHASTPATSASPSAPAPPAQPPEEPAPAADGLGEERLEPLLGLLVTRGGHLRGREQRITSAKNRK